MLGWVITCHDDTAQDMLHRLEKKFGSQAQCRAVGFWRGLSSNMLSRMMCDALHDTDSGEGVIFLTDIPGAAPYRAAALMSHKHSQCEVISGVTYPLLERMLLSRESMSSAAFRNQIVSLGGPDVTSLWHQQQKNPPFVLKHDLYEY
ncbi:PTS sugar transporter subunit IIA [Citrobacter freundii]|jgi:PTS system ascorbate-specific IIA component|uniref:PTS sugar transporter subunit IIA n=2 Tax=Citrobacter freundii complex TaxID=1344959 RepID=A0ABD7B323_CITFR|nr:MULTISPECIES: PTS sugar transporter subunit IIA [Citrobacter]STE18347.1 PTS system transporter subunit IIA [Escherichia coli]NTZ50197.1 PTS sugar transporter subunit IIA [Citrobacter gillenii]QCA19844.1 PTS sugar transporter subunit IIA [Citrobacter freundii]QLO44086.1 PTS sugar transporter subunit IIA [Citrobacter freundii]QLV42249.1 PTS sugar transporter subunit IIA [Citrobacter freundii]